MPNYVSNSLTITGCREERERFVKECINDDQDFDFGKLIPEPEELPKTDGPFPDWYQWRCDHWGSKWNASDTDLTVSDDKIELFFSTAWSPPLKIFDEIQRRFPKLTIAGNFREYNNCIGGRFVLHDGECDYADETAEIRAAWVRMCNEPDKERQSRSRAGRALDE